ncbi:sodium channel protein Nach [Sabethes cyaneus]|uniref:sodium channel protein Nach n=1 Tax=Sabethes cyaneus TaxID=53552 RepID=UPI00237E0276|nr:sodium channel protein Nach [Sabethes cyaneus]
MRFIRHIQTFILKLLGATSAHGFQYVVQAGVHIVERVFWICWIVVGVFGMVALAQRTWNRYQTSPVVISMDRNMYLWNTSFPSVTVCPHQRIDESKVQRYIQQNPAMFTTVGDAEDFLEFVTKLANATYDTFVDLPMHKTFGIASADYLDLIRNLSRPFLPQISSATILPLRGQETITELGICMTVNSKVADYNTYQYWQSNRWDLLPEPQTAVVHPLDGEVYGQLIKLESSYEVYFHGYMEVPDISKQRYLFLGGFYTTVELLALELITSSAVKELSVSQRQCRFSFEADGLEFSPIYSYNLCRIECRMRLAVQYCGCIPHFYRNQGKRGNIRYKICDFEGYRCLGSNSDALITLRHGNKPIDCQCVPNCDFSNFFVQAYKSREWFLGANLQWGLTDYPKMQLHRDIIFGLSDVFVYIGGLGGFFLGCSLLTFTEFVYFLTWRLFTESIAKRRH